MDNYININGKVYALDLEKAMEFVSKNYGTMSTINQTYSNDDAKMTLVNKEVTETKENVSEVMSGYRYNMLSNILNLILVPISVGESIILTEDQNNMHFGQKLAFNTLLEMEIIYEIETED